MNMYFCIMTILNLKSFFQSELKNIYPINEIDSFYHILTEFKLGMSRVDKALSPELTINEAEIVFFKNAISELRTEKPIQYITEETEFHGLPFKLNKGVLIPRPETEELVSWVLEVAPKNKEITILDIGTGSGCIAISLAKNLPNAKVSAIDFSASAIEVAKKNAILNNVNIEFLQQDILKTKKLSNDFDYIIKI